MKLDSLASLLSEAHWALPQAISIGKWLKELPQQSVDDMVKRVHTAVEGEVDGRLATQYALYILCAQKVMIFTEHMYLRTMF